MFDDKPDRLSLWIDEKNRVIDLPASHFQIPDTSIYDEPVRYYKANYKWAKIIEGFVSWLADNTVWDDIEHDGSEAEQAILTFIEGVEPMGLTDDDVQRICEGVSCGILDVFARALAGDPDNTSGTITIGDDGQIIVGGGGSGSLPTTTEAQRLRMGGMELIERRLNEYFVDYEDFYSLAPIGDTDNMLELLSAKYSLNASVSDAIADYIAWRGATNPAPNPSVEGVGIEFYCLGLSKAILTGWYIDNGVADLFLMLSLIGALTDEQLDIWYDQNNDGISDAYIQSECYRLPDVVYELESSGWTLQTTPTRYWKPITPQLLGNRKYEVLVDTTMIDGSDIFDGMYLDDGTDKTYQPIRFDNDNNASGSIAPETQPLYSATGYSVVYNLTATTTYAHIYALNLNDFTGSLTLTFKDRGAL